MTTNLRNIEELAKTPKSDPKYQENINQAIRLYNQICLSPNNSNISNKKRVETLISMLTHIPVEGLDVLSRWRDMTLFLKNKAREYHLELLKDVIVNEGISSHERLLTAVTLYNQKMIHICYPSFEKLALDQNMLIGHRIEACRYLFISEDIEYLEVAQEVLLDIIDTIEYPCDYRYKIITSFVFSQKRGFSTLFNFGRIKIPYNEEFVSGLQMVFFYNTENDIRYRILSGQNLLQMETIDQKEKEKIANQILLVANDDTLDENTRADAADVVLRLCQGQLRTRARGIIQSLGRGGDNFKNTRNLYEDSQNVHNQGISESILKFIENFIENVIHKYDEGEIPSFEMVHSQVIKLINSKELIPKDKIKTLRSLNRISIDTSTFTKYNIGLAEIFVHVWLRMRIYKPEEQETLQNRLIEELIDMSETCSSGHYERLINVLSLYDSVVKIDWKDQIIANISGRLNASIRDAPEDIRDTLACGAMSDADKEEKKVYRNFLKENLKLLKEELYEEFVGGNYVTKEDFENAFKEGRDNWLK